jgi:hypothetical protein
MTNQRCVVRVLGFALWLIMATFAATSLTSWHSVSLPVRPGRPTALRGSAGHWHLTHYLSADCACSQAVARHLITRGPVSVAAEEVVLVESSDIPAQNTLRDALSRRGFSTMIVTPETVSADDGIDGVPVLRINAPDGTQRFRGGYRDRGAADGVYLDLAILSDLMASRPVSAPHVYGCATSRLLRSLLDPLSLRSLSFPKIR